MKKPDCKNCKLQTQGKWDFKICDACEKKKRYSDYLESRRKFKRGEPIKTLDELLKQDFVMWYGRTKHISVICNWQLNFVVNTIEKGWLHYAVRKEDNK